MLFIIIIFIFILIFSFKDNVKKELKKDEKDWQRILNRKYE